MIERRDADYAWGPVRSGLQAGIRLVAPGADPDHRDVQGAVRNIAGTSRHGPAICELRIRRGNSVTGLDKGPSALPPATLAPGQVLQAANWRIDRSICHPAARCSLSVWCLVARNRWLYSAEVIAVFGEDPGEPPGRSGGTVRPRGPGT